MALSLFCLASLAGPGLPPAYASGAGNKALIGLASGRGGQAIKVDADSQLPSCTKDGAAFIEEMYRSASAQTAYSFNFTMTVYKGKKPTVEKGRFYYKKPGLIRLEEKGPYKKGAVAVLGDNGKVKAHLGGNLSLFVVELSRDNQMLRSANGHPMVESDFRSLAEALKQFLKEGVASRVTARPVMTDSSSRPVYLLEMRKGKGEGRLWKRIAVDSKTHLPVEWWDYRDDGKLWSHATWRSFESVADLPDDLFDAHKSSSESM